MALEEAIFVRAGSFAGLTAIIGSGSGARCYPLKLPQPATLPAMTYQRIIDEEPQAMGVAAGVTTARMQLSAWATTADGARDLAVQIRAAFRRWRGSVSGVVIQDSLPAGRTNDDDAVVGLHWWHLDFLISYEEA